MPLCELNQFVIIRSLHQARSFYLLLSLPINSPKRKYSERFFNFDNLMRRSASQSTSLRYALFDSHVPFRTKSTSLLEPFGLFSALLDFQLIDLILFQLLNADKNPQSYKTHCESRFSYTIWSRESVIEPWFLFIRSLASRYGCFDGTESRTALPRFETLDITFRRSWYAFSLSVRRLWAAFGIIDPSISFSDR